MVNELETIEKKREATDTRHHVESRGNDVTLNMLAGEVWHRGKDIAGLRTAKYR